MMTLVLSILFISAKGVFEYSVSTGIFFVFNFPAAYRASTNSYQDLSAYAPIRIELESGNNRGKRTFSIQRFLAMFSASVPLRGIFTRYYFQ